MTISGAYGRDYRSRAAVLADWLDGKDFIMRGLQSGYINRADAERDGIKSVTVRYQKDRQVVVFRQNPKGVWK